ncbi:RNA polymerase II transcription regulator [Malassezia pachydermatis]
MLDVPKRLHDVQTFCGMSSKPNKSHVRIHTQDRPYVCPFPNCDKRFIQKSALNVHINVHTGARPYVCTECFKAFADTSSLARHRRTHSGKRPYKCQVLGCGKEFCRRTTLTRHVKRVHPEEDRPMTPSSVLTFPDMPPVPPITAIKSEPVAKGMATAAERQQPVLLAPMSAPVRGSCMSWLTTPHPKDATPLSPIFPTPTTALSAPCVPPPPPPPILSPIPTPPATAPCLPMSVPMPIPSQSMIPGASGSKMDQITPVPLALSLPPGPAPPSSAAWLSTMNPNFPPTPVTPSMPMPLSLPVPQSPSFPSGPARGWPCRS